MLSTLLTDELADQADKAIRAQMDKVKRSTDEMLYHTLRRKLHVQDGVVYFLMQHPVLAERYDVPLAVGQGPHDRGHEWATNSRAKLLPLAEGLALYFDPKSPEAELSRRLFVLEEEHRQLTIRGALADKEMHETQAAQRAEHTRRVAWNSLDRSARVAARVRMENPSATALDMLDMTANEQSGHSVPPAGWVG